MKLRIPWLTLSFAAVAGLLQLVPGAAGQLQFDRPAIAAGEVWRGLTGHLVHFNASHFAWDVFALLFLGSWAEIISRRGMLLTFLLSALSISATVWCLLPHLAVYRGLSGVDSAFIGFVVAHLLRRARQSGDRWDVAVPAVAGLLFLGKSLFELATGQILFAQTGGAFSPVPAAHLVGFGAGVVASVLLRVPQVFLATAQPKPPFAPSEPIAIGRP